MDSFRQRPSRKIAVGYIAPALAGILTPALRKFTRDHGDIEVALTELALQDQVTALRDRRADAAAFVAQQREDGDEGDFLPRSVRRNERDGWRRRRSLRGGHFPTPD